MELENNLLANILFAFIAFGYVVLTDMFYADVTIQEGAGEILRPLPTAPQALRVNT